MISDDERALLEKLHAAMPGLSMDALQIFWSAFKAEAIRRIAVERKSLDLGFVKIVLVPWRQNWKEALMARFRKPFTRLWNNEKVKPEAELAAQGFYHEMSSPRLLAIDRHRKFIHRSIECLPSKELQMAADEHEYALKEKLGDVDYAIQMMDEVPELLPMAMSIMKWYARRVCYPRAESAGMAVLRILEPVEDDVRHGKLSPTRIPEIEDGPNISSSADKSTQSPGTSTRSQLAEIFSDPLPEEPQAGTGGAFG